MTTGQAGVALRGRNPDVLTCIANLSNDEVFTPPELANKMLDAVGSAWTANNGGADIWADPSVRFLDPFAKSGVFLREVTRRLTDGLEPAIPKLEDRVDHILTKQVFGVAITQLTSLLARRSVYCSKFADGEHSIAKSFGNDVGNILYERIEHTWIGATEFENVKGPGGKLIKRGTNGKCKYCGASQGTFDRGAGRETHAYAFIHNDDIRARIAELFGDDMQFDVIIGNPPYQLQSDGGTRDIPIYHHFVRQAKTLAPRFLSMVIPARWMAGGLGLNDFREEMLGDPHLRSLTDYPVAKEVFPSVEVKGGICYFLWDPAYEGPCLVTNVRDRVATGPTPRDLNEFDVFVREAEAVKILRKVLSKSETSITTMLSVDKEFGWTSNFDGFHATRKSGDVPVYYVRSLKRGSGFIERKRVTKSAHLIDKWKVLIPKAGSDGGQRIPDVVLGKPWVVPSPSTTTQSFLFFHVDTEVEARNVQSYLATRFFRFLVSLRKITQDATRSTYEWVPVQDFSKTWSDDKLRKKYGLTDTEWAYIEKMIRPMELDAAVADD